MTPQRRSCMLSKLNWRRKTSAWWRRWARRTGSPTRLQIRCMPSARYKDRDILPKVSCKCLGFKIQAFSESEYGLYAVSGFRLYADSGSRLMLNPDTDFFVVSVSMIFADPSLNFSDQKVKKFLVEKKNILI
jgi:hypothetical protein